MTRPARSKPWCWKELHWESRLEMLSPCWCKVTGTRPSTESIEMTRRIPSRSHDCETAGPDVVLDSRSWVLRVTKAY